ncbi:hypothetical protein GGR58DRAFT_32335 [Xylaria digitata]|nr:hypothetical protein GGR58DRAFT_32335 [Xylaria digitata]
MLILCLFPFVLKGYQGTPPCYREVANLYPCHREPITRYLRELCTGNAENAGQIEDWIRSLVKSFDKAKGEELPQPYLSFGTIKYIDD